MNTHETKPVPVLRGVSLAQYAAVQAGLAEGIDIESVLEDERIDPASWLEADDAWSGRILEDLEQDGPLQHDFDEHLAKAQTRYGRRIPPLDEKLDAWLDFVRHWSGATEPIAFLATLDLRPSDITRLHRSWSQRLALEPALAQQAQEILSREPGEAPVPRPASRELDRPPHPPTPPASTIDDDPLDPSEPRLFVDSANWLGGEAPSTTMPEIVSEAPSVASQEPDLEITVLPVASPLRRAGIVSAPAIPAVVAAPEPAVPHVVMTSPRAAQPTAAPPRMSDDAASTTAPMQPGIFRAVLPFAQGTPPIITIAHHGPEPIRRTPIDLNATAVVQTGPITTALPFLHRGAPTPAVPETSRLPPSDLESTGVMPSGLPAAAFHGVANPLWTAQFRRCAQSPSPGRLRPARAKLTRTAAPLG